MPSNVPEFKNVRYKRLLTEDWDAKGIQPFLVVTQEVNCHILWRVTSQGEIMLCDHGKRDELIDQAAPRHMQEMV